jgi:predicted dehydrogenase
VANQYRVGIIGTGGIAKAHARYYVENEKTELVAGADIHAGRLGEFCEAFSLPARYGDYHELLEKEKPDVVSVCTWQESHPEITIACAEAGVKAIMCEKPMGEDLAGPEEMVQVCEDRGVKLAIHHQSRYRPSIVAIRDLLGDSAIGTPVSLVWHTGDGLLNSASHAIDWYRFMLGDPVWELVVGQAGRHTNRYERGTPIEDFCTAIVHYEGGHEMLLECDVNGGKVRSGQLIVGPEGMINVAGREASIMTAESRGWQPIETEEQLNPVEALIAWLEGGPEHRARGRVCLEAQSLMMALYDSAKTRTIVRNPLLNKKSALNQLIDDGTLAVPDEEPYDIRREDALRVRLGRG